MMDDKLSEIVKIETPEVAAKEGNCKLIRGRMERNAKEEKVRKKDDKSVEQLMKGLSNLETPGEKLTAMCKKYSEIVEENRRLQLALKQTEKKVAVVQREKEQFQSEHSKAILTRSRLESLCRELQKQNKAVKEESLLKIREEEEKRKEVSAKFQSTLSEINALMSQNNEKNNKLHQDNLEMTEKFKSVCEQYEIRDQQLEKIQQHMKLEAQLSEAKLAKANLEMNAEKEVLLREIQQLISNATEYQVVIRGYQASEAELREQMSLYTGRFSEFQDALMRSNKIYLEFKDQMEKMSKKILKLEKETSSWKLRWKNSHAALQQMAADKQQRDTELATASRKLTQLQQLCRALQGERTSLLAQLRGQDKSVEEETTEQTVTEEDIKSPTQVDDLSKDCQQLKADLVQLQGSLAEAIRNEEEQTLLQEQEEEVQNDEFEEEEADEVVVPETEVQGAVVIDGDVEQPPTEAVQVKNEICLNNSESDTSNATEPKPKPDDNQPTENETASLASVEATPNGIKIVSATEQRVPESENSEPTDNGVVVSDPSVLEADDKSPQSVSSTEKTGKDGKKKRK